MYHFANFVYNRTTGEGFGSAELPSRATPEQRALALQNRKGFEQTKKLKKEGEINKAVPTEYSDRSNAYQDSLSQQRRQYQENRNAQTRQMQSNAQNSAAAQKASRQASKAGFLGKAKYGLGKVGGFLGRNAGALTTGAFILPSLASLIPQGQQTQQQQEYDD